MADIPSQQRACCEEEANFLGVLADKEQLVSLVRIHLMGKSAKLHKRIPKRLKSSSSSSATSTATTSQSQVHMAKKRATLKEKAGKGNTAHDSKRVLGDVDYVALMMGGRRKAKQEAEKLAHDA